MKFICRRCDNRSSGRRYRVSSKQDGMTLMDVTVCRDCYEQAVSLGLHARPVPSKILPLARRRSAPAGFGAFR